MGQRGSKNWKLWGDVIYGSPNTVMWSNESLILTNFLATEMRKFRHFFRKIKSFKSDGNKNVDLSNLYSHKQIIFKTTMFSFDMTN